MGVSIGSHVYYSIDIGGKSVPLITDAAITMCVVTIIVILAVVLSTRNLKQVPTGVQNIAEYLVEFINNLTKNQIGHHYKAFSPIICAFFVFLLMSNTIAIFNVIPSGETVGRLLHIPQIEHFEYGLHPPTKNFNVTVCMALIMITIVVGSEFRYRGFRGWLKSFYTPTPIFGFVKILDYFVRPLSLCLRLFGSIMGGSIAMSLLYVTFPLVLPAFVSMYFDLFDGALQAYVFVFLSTMYISEAVEEVEEVK